MHGYPEDKEFIQNSVRSKGAKAEKETFEYESNAISGMNGGPIAITRIVTESYSEHYLIGVHLKDKLSVQTKATKNIKVGVRLTKEKFD